MKRALKFILVVALVLTGLVVALWQYAYYNDQKNFAAAKNPCERGCIQDSGGIDQCRPICEKHPDHYP